MKKKILLLILVVFSVQSSFAWWTDLSNTGTPWKTYYLGDNQSDVFFFSINRDTSSPMAVSYGIGTTSNGSGWTWRAAEFSSYIDPNRTWKSKANEHQFTSTGNWYYSGRFVWTSDGYTEYASAAWAENRITLSATSYFTVLAIVDPSSQTATSASYSNISLSWSKNTKANNVMVVRYDHGATVTAPTNGSAYSAGNTIGSGTVIYNGTATGTTSSGLNSSTHYDYYFYSVNNNYYSPGVYATANTGSKNTDYFRSKSTGNWEVAANWESSLDNVNWITATSYPEWHAAIVSIENGHKITVDYSSSATSLTIKPTGQLTINLNYTLAVTGNLLIQSDATGTGTFVDKNPGSGYSIYGTSTIEQYLGSARSWYLSSPITVGTTSNLLSTNVFSYNETTNNWDTESGSLTKGKGYFAQSPSGNLTFIGPLNNGTITKTLTRRNATNVNFSGFNLVGNPYPSYLDWAAVWNYTPNGGATYPNQTVLVSSTMWYRTKESGEWAFATVNGAGQVSSPKATTATKNIPPMQAFWVRASNVGNSSLTLTNAMRLHESTTNLLKAPAAVKISDRQLIRLQVNNGASTDETLIYSDPNASNGFDPYDSPKFMETNDAATQIYTTADNEQLVINGLNTLLLDSEIGLGFVPGDATSFSIRANEVSNLPAGVKVILKDNGNNGFETDLTDGVTTYEFAPATTSDDRFSLIFRSPGAITGLPNNDNINMLVYSNANRQITVSGSKAGSTIRVYNTTGQQIAKKTMQITNTIIDVPAAGVYMVRVGDITRKVVAP